MSRFFSRVISILASKLGKKDRDSSKKPQTRTLVAEPLEERLPVSSSAAGVLLGLGLAQDQESPPAYESPQPLTHSSLSDLMPEQFSSSPLDLQLDSFAVDRIHGEESLLDTGSSASDDPFVLTPLAFDSALNETEGDAHRELGDELLLFQISTLDFRQVQFEPMMPERTGMEKSAETVSHDFDDALNTPDDLTAYGYSPIANDLQDNGDSISQVSCCCGGTPPRPYTSSLMISSCGGGLLYTNYSGNSQTWNFSDHTLYTAGTIISSSWSWSAYSSAQYSITVLNDSSYLTVTSTSMNYASFTWTIPSGKTQYDVQNRFAIEFKVWDNYGGSDSVVMYVHFIAMSLEKVKFKDNFAMVADPGLPTWDTDYDWVKDQPTATNPVAYANGANKIKVNTEFKGGVTPPPAGMLEVRFVASGLPSGAIVTSDWQSVEKIGSIYKVTGVTALNTLQTIYGSSQSDFIASMKLSWEFRVPSRFTGYISGVSTNPFYVTQTEPSIQSSGKLYHTVVHTGCTAAKGKMTEQAIFDAIWGKFASLNMNCYIIVDGVVTPRKETVMVNGTPQEQNVVLTYYGREPNNPNVNAPNSNDCLKKYILAEKINGVAVSTQSISRFREYWENQEDMSIGYTEKLLKFSDGNCDSWQNFMIDVLGTQGIMSKHESVTGELYEFFKVKSYKGQGNVYPKEFIFPHHKVVEYAGNVYDPSYGVILGASEDASGNPVDTYIMNFIAKLESEGNYEVLPQPHFTGHKNAYVAMITY